MARLFDRRGRRQAPDAAGQHPHRRRRLALRRRRQAGRSDRDRRAVRRAIVSSATPIAKCLSRRERAWRRSCRCSARWPRPARLEAAELYFGCRTRRTTSRARSPRCRRARSSAPAATPRPTASFHGRVTQALAGLAFDPATTDFYICGSAAMVADCRAILERAGAQQIFDRTLLKDRRASVPRNSWFTETEVFLLHEIVARLDRLARKRVLDAIGLSYAEFLVAMAVNEMERPTQGEVGELLDMSKSLVSQRVAACWRRASSSSSATPKTAGRCGSSLTATGRRTLETDLRAARRQRGEAFRRPRPRGRNSCSRCAVCATRSPPSRRPWKAASRRLCDDSRAWQRRAISPWRARARRSLRASSSARDRALPGAS